MELGMEGWDCDTKKGPGSPTKRESRRATFWN